MKIEIKNRFNGSIVFSIEAKSLRLGLEIAVGQEVNLHSADLRSANLHSANLRSANLSYANLSYADLHSADLHSANLSYADLHSADLSSANLHSANLHSADLSSANLRSANLSYANLSYADLHSADLHSAKGINKHSCTPLLILKEQTGNIRAYKLVNNESEGIYRGGIKYVIGKTVKVDDIDENENEQCAAGINLATLDWCMKEWQEDYRILIAEFPRWIKKDGEKIDNIIIPIATDGKFRVRKCKIVGEKDLVEIGLTKT